MLGAIGAAEVAFGFALIASMGSATEQLAKGTASVHAQIASIG